MSTGSETIVGSSGHGIKTKKVKISRADVKSHIFIHMIGIEN